MHKHFSLKKQNSFLSQVSYTWQKRLHLQLRASRDTELCILHIFRHQRYQDRVFTSKHQDNKPWLRTHTNLSLGNKP